MKASRLSRPLAHFTFPRSPTHKKEALRPFGLALLHGQRDHRAASAGLGAQCLCVQPQQPAASQGDHVPGVGGHQPNRYAEHPPDSPRRD